MKAAARKRRSFGASSGAKASDAETACLRGSTGKGGSADEGARSLRQAKTNFAEKGGGQASKRAYRATTDDEGHSVPQWAAVRHENRCHMIASSIQKPSPRSSRGMRDGSVIRHESPVTYGSLPKARAGCGETGRFFLLLAQREKHSVCDSPALGPTSGAVSSGVVPTDEDVCLTNSSWRREDP